MAQDNNEMIPVPIPTEIPEPPRLDQLPLDILHSATVELLIQQNEDLSSRLKVNIRRNSQLELKILESDREIKTLNQKRDNLLAQMEIVKEKEKIWTSKKEKAEKRAEVLEKESELLELRYNELYTTSRQKAKEQRATINDKQSRINQLERNLEVLMRVRLRAKEKLREFLLDMAHGFQKNQKNIRKSQSSQKVLQKNFEYLRSEIQEKEEFFKAQLENLKRASQTSLHALDEKLATAQAKNESFIKERDDLRQEIKDLTRKLHDEKKIRIKVSQLTKELDALRNERIKFKREMQKAVEESENSRLHECKKFEDMESLHKETMKQFEENKNILSSCEDQLLLMKKENRELHEQLSSVQSLWVETQSRLEKEEIRSQSLEKINRQLSHQAQKEKVERATQRAHQPESLNDEKVESENREFQDKIKDVFASQYRTLGKSPDMDV